MKVLFLGGLWHRQFRDVACSPLHDGPYHLPDSVEVAQCRTLSTWRNPDSPLAVVQTTTTIYVLRQVDVGDPAAPVGLAYVAGDYDGPPLWSDPAGGWELFDHSPSGG